MKHKIIDLIYMQGLNSKPLLSFTFQVPQEYKKQMRVVMLTEEHFSSPEMTSSRTECIIVETD